MKKIYSIGLHKTGSTSLQWFLTTNQWALAQSGILYPPTNARGYARMIADGLGKSNQPPSHINEYMGHNALAYRLLSEALPGYDFPQVHRPAPSGDTMIDMIEQLAELTHAKALVLCSEDLARLSLRAPDALNRLKSRFGADQTCIMCTIRRPDQAIAAWQSQVLKGPTTPPRLQDSGIDHYLNSVHFDYQRILSPWLRCFPDVDLDLRPYSDVLAHGGSIENFKNNAGVTLPDTLVDAGNRNLGLHPALLEILRLARLSLSPAEAYLLRNWLERKQDTFDLPPKNEIELLGQDNRTLLATAFTPIHSYLSKLTGRAAFFDDIEDMTTPNSICNIEASRQALPRVQAAAKLSGLSQDTKSFLQDLNSTGL